MADKGFKRKLTAIPGADAEGYSRLSFRHPLFEGPAKMDTTGLQSRPIPGPGQMDKLKIITG